MNGADQCLDHITGLGADQSSNSTGEDSFEIGVRDDLGSALRVPSLEVARDGDREVGDGVTEVLEWPEGASPRSRRRAEKVSIPELVADLTFDRLHHVILAERFTAPSTTRSLGAWPRR